MKNLFYVTTLSTLLGCTLPTSGTLKNSCEEIQLAEGVYFGMIKDTPHFYHMDKDKFLCMLIKQIENVEIIFDYGCDNKFDLVGNELGFFIRKDYSIQKKNYLDHKLEQGQSLVCPENKVDE